MDLGPYTVIECFFIVLWIMMPAYLANTIAVLTGGRYPIDQGKFHNDGNRILGDGKPWSGLIGGTLGGVFIGYLQINLGNGLIEFLSGAQYLNFWGEKSIFVDTFCQGKNK